MLWADKALEQRRGVGGRDMCWVPGKRNVLWRGEVKSFLEYNGRKSIKEEDKGSMSHRKLEAGVEHT